MNGPRRPNNSITVGLIDSHRLGTAYSAIAAGGYHTCSTITGARPSGRAGGAPIPAQGSDKQIDALATFDPKFRVEEIT